MGRPSRLIFTDVSVAARVNFLHYRQTFDFMPFGAGVVVFDYNGDGNEDIYITAAADAFQPDRDGSNALYRNNGDGTFTNVSLRAGEDDPLGKGNGGCAADYDNDGDQDLFVANWGSSKLFNNSGDGTFTDVTAEAGLGDPDATYRSMGCAWGDYDRDGFLDFIVVRHMSESALLASDMRVSARVLRPLALYHNNRDGSFTNVTSLLGNVTAPDDNGESYGSVEGVGFQPGWADYDNDGDPDLYVVNDFGADIVPNVLWRNDGRWVTVSYEATRRAGCSKRLIEKPSPEGRSCLN